MTWFAVKGLSRTVEGRSLFSRLSFSLAQGETLVLRGASGTGKTVLLRALAMLDPLKEGEVALQGRGPDQWGYRVWRSRVCHVPQHPPVLPGTPREYFDMVAHLRVQEGRDHGDPLIFTRRWGLKDEQADQQWSKLSGGEKQRFFLAVALAWRPDVLLLDEPTSALDAAAEEAVEADLHSVTSIWATHDARQSNRVASRVLQLKDHVT
ncbi:MAG: ABC transporter ATP-binding protein [Proteobacteria bacterium]|jgi:ABC-type iron transport system FetAB ATPase subunit|nr:ABC transporter ATP-binding protein [Pseudomonadota bacterium]